MTKNLQKFLRAFFAVGILFLLLPGGKAFAALNDACSTTGSGPNDGIITSTSPLTCTATSSLSQGSSCSGNYYYDATAQMCVANESSCNASGLPGTYTSGSCTAATTPTTGMSCGGNQYYNGTACVTNGTSDSSCVSPNVWQSGTCVAPAPSPSTPATSGSLNSAASSLQPGGSPGGGQQPICVNSSPIIGYGLGIVAGSTLCYGTAADVSGTNIYAYHTSSTQSWDGLNVQDLFARGDITALGTLSVYGGAQIYSPDLNTGLVVVNGQLLAASTSGSNSSSMSVKPDQVFMSSTDGAATTSMEVKAARATTSSASGSNVTSFEVATTGTTTATQNATNKTSIEVKPDSVTTTTQAGTGASPTDYATTTQTTDSIVNKVASGTQYSQTSATSSAYTIKSTDSANTSLTSTINVDDQSIKLTTGNGVLASNGTTGLTSGSHSGGISVYQQAQTIAPNTTISDLLNGEVYQNKVNGNLFVDGNVYINGLLRYVSSSAATTTVTSSSTSILGASLTTSGGSTIVMKGTDAQHAVVDQNGKITLVSGVSEQSSSAMTLTNGFNNVHGFMVNETQATMSGGIYSSSMTLNDNGATFSNSASGSPIQVHGVNDGTADFDAVNVRQLANSVAAMSAANSIPVPEAGRRTYVGVGIGSYMGKTALAIGINHRMTPLSMLKATIASGVGGNAKPVIGVGVGWGW